MRKSRFTETQIVKTLQQVEGGRTVKEVCRELGISEATYFNWKSKYGGRRFRTFNVVDGFSREGLAIEIDLNLPAARVILVLDRIAAWRGYPQKLRLDNDPELISVALAEWAEAHCVKFCFIPPGRPMQNGFIERFNGSYRCGVLDMYDFRTLTDTWRTPGQELIIGGPTMSAPTVCFGCLTPEEDVRRHSEDASSEPHSSLVFRRSDGLVLGGAIGSA